MERAIAACNSYAELKKSSSIPAELEAHKQSASQAVQIFLMANVDIQDSDIFAQMPNLRANSQSRFVQACYALDRDLLDLRAPWGYWAEAKSRLPECLKASEERSEFEGR